MKKGKNAELKESYSLPVHIKEGKLKKKEHKNVKRLKDAVDKTNDVNLAPKKGIPESKPNNDKAQKKKNISFKQEFTEEDQNVSNDKNKTAKQKKTKSGANKQKDLHTETPLQEFTEADLKRIEKKNAKKLAKRLRKAENKDKGPKNTTEANTNVQKLKEVNTDAAKKLDPASSNILTKKAEKLSHRLKKAENKIKAPKQTPEADTNGVQKLKEVNTDAAKKLDATSSKVLSKKEKKAEKRKLIKEQKLAEKQTPNPAVKASTIFVGNLPVNTKRVQLIRLFKAFAPVNSIRIRSAGGKVLLKHKQRKEAGSLNAYVVLKNKETAEKAISLNGVEFKGHHLRITLTEKRPQSHEKEEAKRTVFVGNLKYSATEESLREIFSSCGEVDYVRCIRDGDKGCKGVAYVCFKAADGVGLALELNGTIVDERPINVEHFSVKKLGAKEARDAQAEKEKKSKPGAKQRIDGKKGKKEKSEPKNNNNSNADDAKKAKKSEFRGVKVEGLKKKLKSKKKKSNDQMLQLAKKIAPKIKTN